MCTQAWRDAKTDPPPRRDPSGADMWSDTVLVRLRSYKYVIVAGQCWHGLDGPEWHASILDTVIVPWRLDGVTHWMPLPDPPDGVEP